MQTTTLVTNDDSQHVINFNSGKCSLHTCSSQSRSPQIASHISTINDLYVSFLVLDVMFLSSSTLSKELVLHSCNLVCRHSQLLSLRTKSRSDISDFHTSRLEIAFLVLIFNALFFCCCFALIRNRKVIVANFLLHRCSAHTLSENAIKNGRAWTLEFHFISESLCNTPICSRNTPSSHECSQSSSWNYTCEK